MNGRAFALLMVAACLLIGSEAHAQSPGPRFGHELVYDAGREVTLLFGGFGPDGVPLGDTWIWDGTSWTAMDVPGPSPRKWPAAAYDQARGVIVLHGGREGVGRSGPSLSDTWTWDGGAWSEVRVPGPSPRDHHRADYDSARERVVLFGGWNGSGLEGDTWEWDGRSWSRRSTVGPSPRAPTGMAYDEASGRTVLFGGQNLDRAFADLWVWDGQLWTELDVDGPARRGFHGMTYSPDQGSVLIYGGRDGDDLMTDLWRLQGMSWELVSQTGPQFRGVHAMVYERARGELVMHGSGILVGGQWLLDGRTWARRPGEAWRVVADPSVRRP